LLVYLQIDGHNGGHFLKNSTKNLTSLNSSKKSAPSTPSKAVNFSENPDGEKHREKYLTAKYGAHQMALIRKVEMLMFDQLQELQDLEVRGNIYNLDIEDDIQRKIFVRIDKST
jgi:hypothetical protein